MPILDIHLYLRRWRYFDRMTAILDLNAAVIRRVQFIIQLSFFIIKLNAYVQLWCYCVNLEPLLQL